MTRSDKRSSTLLGLALSALALGISACGGSGSSSGTVSSSSGGSGSGTVSAFVTKAPITGAICYLYTGNKSSPTRVAGPQTSSSGNVTFSNVAVSVSSTYMVECSGGDYTDESTGSTKSAPTMRGAVVAQSTSPKVIINPITHIAVEKSQSNFSDFSEQARNVGAAFGLGDVDITNTIPANLNAGMPANDSAGLYGTALATFSQYVRDFGSGSVSVSASTLSSALSGNALNAVQKQNMLNAISAMSANPNLSGKANPSVADAQFSNIATVAPSGTTPSAYVLPYSVMSNPVQPLIYNQPVTITGQGGSLPSGVNACLTNGGTCGAVTLEKNATQFTVQCNVPPSGASTQFNLTTASACSSATSTQEIVGSKRTFTTQQTSATNTGIYITEVIANSTFSNQTSGLRVPYASQMVYTIRGGNIPSTATANLGGNACTVHGSTADTSSRAFICRATNDRTQTTANLNLISGTASIATSVTLTTPSISVDATTDGATPSTIQWGANGSSSWSIKALSTVSGNTNSGGLHDGLIFKLNDTLCGTNADGNTGSAGEDGLTMTGINCSNVTAPASGSSTLLTAEYPSGTTVYSRSIALSSVPAATISWQSGSTAERKINGAVVINKAYVDSGSSTSCQTGSSITYTLVTSPTSGVLTLNSGSTITVDGSTHQFRLTPGGTAGTATITATASAVSGQCTSSTGTFTITVSENNPVDLSDFGTSSANITYGDNPTSTGANTYSQTTSSTTAGATISYSIDSQSPSGIASVNSSSGLVTITGAGTIVVKATGTLTNYPTKTKSYTINVGKRNVYWSPTTPSTTSAALGTSVTNNNSFRVYANGGSGYASGEPFGSITYSVTSGSDVIDVLSTGVVYTKKQGTATVKVSYAGNANFMAAQDLTYNISVTKAGQSSVYASWSTTPSTSMTLGSESTPSATVTKNITGPDPTVSVNQFTYSITPNNGVVTWTVSSNVLTLRAAQVGTTKFCAVYSGDTNYTAGSQVCQDITVNKVTSGTNGFNVTVDAVSDPMYKSETRTLTVRVNAATNVATPTGTVSITSNSTSINLGTTAGTCGATVTLSTGVATCTFTVSTTQTTDTTGVQLTAVYSGDSNYSSASQTSNSFTVKGTDGVTVALQTPSTGTALPASGQALSKTGGNGSGQYTTKFRVVGNTVDFPAGTLTIAKSGGVSTTGTEIGICSTLAFTGVTGTDANSKKYIETGDCQIDALTTTATNVTITFTYTDTSGKYETPKTQTFNYTIN